MPKTPPRLWGLPALVILVAGWWVYRPALHGLWLWDDDILVTRNGELYGLSGLARIWFSAPATDYWPLTWTLLWLERHLWGDNPVGYHACSLGLHIFSGILIWRLLARLGVRWGWVGGLFFVIHPLAVESVAWISEIKNTLSLPFFLLSLDAWLDEEEKRQGHTRSLLFYLAAMLSKTSTVMLPIVILLYIWWKRGVVKRKEIEDLWPFFGLATLLGVITIYVQNHHLLESAAIHPGGMAERLAHAGMAVLFYVGQFLFPLTLIPLYPGEVLSETWLLYFVGLPLLAVVGWSFRSRGRGRHVLFGLGFFLVNLLPVLGLVKMNYMIDSPVADHLVYLPMIGLIGLVVAGFEAAFEKVRGPMRLIFPVFLACACLVLAGKSRGYTKTFQNPDTFWTYTLRHNPQSWVGHDNYGNALREAGRMPEAIEQYELAVKINPQSIGAHNNLAGALAMSGKIPEAIAEYEQALKIDPNVVELRDNLGTALSLEGRLEEAREQYSEALKIDPHNAAAQEALNKLPPR